MAEVVGLVLGVVALAGTFKDCVELFSYIRAARELGRDHEILETKLDVEKTLLLQWAERVCLLGPQYDERLDQPRIRATISRVLASVRLLLSESDELQHRYGLEKETEESASIMRSIEQQRNRKSHSSSGAGRHDGAAAAFVVHDDDIADVPGIISGPRMSQFVRDFKEMNIRIKDRRKKVSSIRKLYWVVKDKDKFEKLIQELSYLTSKLNEIIPDVRGSTVSMLEADLAGLKSVQEMHLLLEASSGSKNLVADMVRRRLAEICEQRILRCLWHRKMDDREQAVAESHFKTLHWALAPPTETVEWDPLPDWLRSGSGIYWVCGKAGSGKSTLMKFLYNHPTTKQLIKQWAGEVPLTTAKFFFWNLGTAEQKTYDGLLRALLYDVLQSDRTLISELLPKMWQEAMQPDSHDLVLPSSVELKSAFQRLGELPSASRKFCYWIDGLDEYAGDYRDAVAFIKNLSRNPNIKVIVSSRPIPACVEAFNGCPRLQLQDLTKDDITAYVKDTLDQHSYMQSVLATDPVQASQLLYDLISKASGVFLWVVLACHSLLDGFDAYDHVSDLQKRVNELPPELEDLFRHMLSKIQPRYVEQAIKLLRLCYQKHCVNGTNPIPTMGLALLEGHAMDLSRIPAFVSMTTEERHAKCMQFEGRLRSRCCGLIELKPRSKRSDSDCLCGLRSHDNLVDSTVEFMHRSVFEFLDIPGIWQSDCLSSGWEGFDASAALTCLALHSTRLSLGVDSDQAERYIKDLLLYGTYVDGPVSDCIIPVLLELELLLPDLALASNHSSFFRCIVARRSWGTTETRFPTVFLLAVEAGMTGFIQLYEAANHPGRPIKSRGFPLLYHAIMRPFLSILPCWYGSVSPSMIKYLLSSKHDPNEMFADEEENAETPWASWLRQMRASDFDKALLTAEVTEMFILAGASIEIVKATVMETLEERIKRQLVHFGMGTLNPVKGREIIRAKGRNLIRLLEEREHLQSETTTKNQNNSSTDQMGGRDVSTAAHEKITGSKRPWEGPSNGHGILDRPHKLRKARLRRSASPRGNSSSRTSAHENLPVVGADAVDPFTLDLDALDSDALWFTDDRDR